MRRVDHPEKLQEAIAYALDHSFKKEFIIEEFLEKVGCSSDTDSFSVNGELRFVSFNAQHFDAEAMNPYTPAAFSWPSTMSAEHEEELTKELQRLIKLLNLQSSIYNIETRECTDGKAYIMECTPRGGGNRLAEMLKYATGVDLIKTAVLAAAGEPVTEIEQRPYDGHWAEVVLHSNKKGIFKELWISQEIQKNIVETDLWVEPGEYIEGFGAANDALGMLVLRFESEKEMKQMVRHVGEYVEVRLEE